MNIYISGRRFGKTTMLIKESAKTVTNDLMDRYDLLITVEKGETK